MLPMETYVHDHIARGRSSALCALAKNTSKDNLLGHLAAMRVPKALAVVPLELITRLDIAQSIHEDSRLASHREEAAPADVWPCVIMIHEPAGRAEPLVAAVDEGHGAVRRAQRGAVVGNLRGIARIVLGLAQELARVVEEVVAL